MPQHLNVLMLMQTYPIVPKPQLYIRAKTIKRLVTGLQAQGTTDRGSYAACKLVWELVIIFFHEFAHNEVFSKCFKSCKS